MNFSGVGFFFFLIENIKEENNLKGKGHCNLSLERQKMSLKLNVSLGDIIITELYNGAFGYLDLDI